MKHEPKQQRDRDGRRRRKRQAAGALAIGLTLAAQPVFAVSLFSNFTPLGSSVPGGSLPEATPFQWQHR